jgi:hypothetical protein
MSSAKRSQGVDQTGGGFEVPSLGEEISDRGHIVEDQNEDVVLPVIVDCQLGGPALVANDAFVLRGDGN